MSAILSNDIADILSKLSDWPTEKRLALARQILRTIEADHGDPPSRSKTLMDLLGLLETEGPPPSDEECRRILEDELLRKYDR